MNNLGRKAATFATEAHGSINQRRKYTDEYYIVHPAAVARMVASVTDDEAMIAAAWLHDVVEDTPVTLATIHDYFGPDVATLVSELTDVSTLADGNRKVRKQMELEHTRQASPRAKTVKLADFIDNARSICEHDKKFAPVFMQEMEQFLAVLTEGDVALYAVALGIVQDYKRLR